MFWLIYISRKLYTDGDYDDLTFDKEDKVKIPIIAYLFGIIISLLPVAGIVFQVFIIIRLVIDFMEKDLYYKPGKITQFLFKEI
jgi:uncharacterized membrane protein